MAEATETDIFQQQKKTIDTLIEVLEKQGQSQPSVMFAPASTSESTEKKTPNYLIYIGVAIAIILFIKKL